MRTLVAEYGSTSIRFKVDHRDRSRTDIEVHPDGSVMVIASCDATDAEIADAVRRRGRWILAQQRYFAQFSPRSTPRIWAPGESHLYLGRQHRLRIGDRHAPASGVRLSGRFLILDGVDFDDASSIERMMRRWYRERAIELFPQSVKRCTERVAAVANAPLSSPILHVREMRTRWGSMSATGRLTLNPVLVRATPTGIDYVVTHELCHRTHPDHGRNFLELLTRAMPDWVFVKQQLERLLA